MKLLKFNKFKFLKKINESTEFADMQLGQLSVGALGSSNSTAFDPSLRVYSDDSSAYIDNYARMSTMNNDLTRIFQDLGSFVSNNMRHNFDYFLEDIEEYRSIKILRIFINNNLKLDIFISFIFMEEEFFGVFRNYNGLNEPRFDSDIFTDDRFSRRIDKEYYIKLNNYFYKVLYNWFIPSPGEYVTLDEIKTKNPLGEIFTIPKNTRVEVKGYNTDQDNDPFLMIKYKKNIYKITKNNYFFFKYRIKKI